VKQRNRIRVLIVGLAIIIFGVFLGLSQKDSEESFQKFEESVTNGTSSLSVDETSEKKTEETTKEIYVYVTGAVLNPGVYVLPAGSRVFQAIEMAGGLTSEADANQMNQALLLSDGYHLHVPKYGEVLDKTVGNEGENPSSDGKVNINTATVEELTQLTGIGESKAKSIVAYREENGFFSSIEDLLNVSGIGEGIFSRIKDAIEV